MMLPKRKSAGIDEVLAEFLQNMGIKEYKY